MIQIKLMYNVLLNESSSLLVEPLVCTYTTYCHSQAAKIRSHVPRSVSSKFPPNNTQFNELLVLNE